jgi:ankyrin repeat protein
MFRDSLSCCTSFVFTEIHGNRPFKTVCTLVQSNLLTQTLIASMKQSSATTKDYRKSTGNNALQPLLSIDENISLIMHFAAEWGHAPMIQLLLDRGASPHAQSQSLSTSFYRAARSGSLEALRLLHLAGSDINAKTGDNWTALFEAVARGIIPVASQLLAWRADPTIVTDSDESALMIISAARNNDRNIFKSHKDIMLNLDAECDQDIDAQKK